MDRGRVGGGRGRGLAKQESKRKDGRSWRCPVRFELNKR